MNAMIRRLRFSVLSAFVIASHAVGETGQTACSFAERKRMSIRAGFLGRFVQGDFCIEQNHK